MNTCGGLTPSCRMSLFSGHLLGNIYFKAIPLTWVNSFFLTCSFMLHVHVYFSVRIIALLYSGEKSAMKSSELTHKYRPSVHPPKPMMHIAYSPYFHKICVLIGSCDQ